VVEGRQLIRATYGTKPDAGGRAFQLTFTAGGIGHKPTFVTVCFRDAQCDLGGGAVLLHQSPNTCLGRPG